MIKGVVYYTKSDLVDSACFMCREPAWTKDGVIIVREKGENGSMNQTICESCYPKWKARLKYV